MISGDSSGFRLKNLFKLNFFLVFFGGVVLSTMLASLWVLNLLEKPVLSFTSHSSTTALIVTITLGFRTYTPKFLALATSALSFLRCSRFCARDMTDERTWTKERKNTWTEGSFVIVAATDNFYSKKQFLFTKNSSSSAASCVVPGRWTESSDWRRPLNFWELVA